jgi:hypothetical protein
MCVLVGDTSCDVRVIGHGLDVQDLITRRREGFLT